MAEKTNASSSSRNSRELRRSEGETRSAREVESSNAHQANRRARLRLAGICGKLAESGFAFRRGMKALDLASDVRLHDFRVFGTGS